MKKLVSIIAAALVLGSLCACGVEKVTISGSTEKPSAVVEQATEESYVFKVDGVSIAMGQDISEFMDSLQGNLGSFDEPSCASDGIDKVYFFKSYQICCFPDGDNYYVYSVTLQDDTVSTAEGLCIGDSVSKITELYGDEPDIDGVNYSYQKGNSQLLITVEEEKVTAINYFVILG